MSGFQEFENNLPQLGTQPDSFADYETPDLPSSTQNEYGTQVSKLGRAVTCID